MANDLGTGVSYVYDEEGYNYDTVVYQKGKPPLDSELNLSQDIINGLRTRQMMAWPSGWMSYYPIYTSMSLENSFYTQNPTGAKPEFAVVNGDVIYFTNTDDQRDNVNFINLGTPPVAGNVVDGIILEVWKALLSPNSSTNKPDPTTIIDSLNCIYMIDGNNGWICGDNGLILRTTNGGQTWSVLLINTKRTLKGIFFATQAIGWLVGNDGVIARTSSSGSNWTLLNSGVSENLTSVHAFDQLTAWAVGTSGTILKTTNGVDWTSLISGVISDLNKIYFYDNLVGWTVGANGTILKTTNGGSTWVIQTSGTTQNLNSIYFYDLNFGFAVGDNGTILRTCNGGGSWVSQSSNIMPGYTTTTEHLKDVTMVPTLDRLEIDEEVTSQLGVAGVSFTVFHKPITKGDGNGTITNNPADITVTVNDIPVLVNIVIGSTGIVVLNSAPGPSTVVKVTYFYKDDSAVFEGKAWIVGTNGSIFYTEDIGAQWTPQTSGTAYDLLSASFINQTTGWTSGVNSIIKNTTDGGTTWSSQQSDQFAHQVERIYYEGNIKTKIYLTDNSIHPDVNIETTKRVQIQYKVRIISGADPATNPEAGLSTTILGEGPNTTGSYPYENMGTINGDYGCWRAKCTEAVDGYMYAIPMFFINRRNSSAYDPQTNPNGSHEKNTSNVRPDLLTAINVVGSDTLDVRRKIVVPSIQKLMTTYFNDLMSNTLKTNFFRSSAGGDRYGTELLQTDRISGSDTDGGTLISNITLDQVVAGTLSSEVTQFTQSIDVPASGTLPTQQVLTAPSGGIFSLQASHCKATYVAALASLYYGKPIPGIFYGQGTNTLTFVFDKSAITTLDVTDYRIAADGIEPSTTALTYVPSDPKLIKNFSGSGSGAAFFYQGVMDTVDYRVLESWASTDAPGFINYVLAYKTDVETNIDQQYRASSVEVHFFTKVITTGTTINFSPVIGPDPSDVQYSIYTIKKINNITAGFSHKLSDMDIGSSITVTIETGYEFVSGSVIEVIVMALSSPGDSNIRNGATVNFSPSLKKIYNFAKSITIATIPVSSTFSVSDPDGGIILGCSTTETSASLNQPVCFVNTHMHKKISVTGFGTSTLTITDPLWVSSTLVLIQLLVKQNELTYNDDASATPDGLLISYNYVPPQCQMNLPTTLTVSPVIVPSVMYVSNLGSGGGTTGDPYLTPLQHIPVADSNITGDSLFSNMDPLQFSNFAVDSGFVQMPVNIPGSFDENMVLSSASVDTISRAFYSVASKESVFACEGLQFPVPRKVFLPIIARVNDPSNEIYMHGEYLLVIFSRGIITEKENRTGYFSNGKCSISIYRLPNRPISRVS